VVGVLFIFCQKKKEKVLKNEILIEKKIFLKHEKSVMIKEEEK
jgi:hypothetical protein